jgi:hypothetical protein
VYKKVKFSLILQAANWIGDVKKYLTEINAEKCDNYPQKFLLVLCEKFFEVYKLSAKRDLYWIYKKKTVHVSLAEIETKIVVKVPTY